MFDVLSGATVTPVFARRGVSRAVFCPDKVLRDHGACDEFTELHQSCDRALTISERSFRVVRW